ncbi:MAG: hypothetical protein Q4C49_04200 [Bacillota bacterium]|nr:hypothetical protein [Bacillota bacterium]
MKLPLASLVLLVLALFDELFALWGVMDFTYQGFCFVPYLTFCGLYAIFYKWHWKDQLFISAFVGLIYDFCFGGMFPVNFILFPLLIGAINVLRMFVRVDRVYRILLGCLAIFLLDAIPVLFSVSFKLLCISLKTWFFNQAILTVIVNGVLLLVIDTFVIDYENTQLRKRA